ncbi:unnamed protein product [Effrenium voratum]|nr:unnamed protein product [Effrenium voratum]|eukprot:CAMPEP_0181420892 /NCGR_PEP_ID=MMETSP1110-20121109/12819_1 /TAXON_ID=174948 /ORGANISM="Symbiodinium sp., Strain CCMP421" /LENGTH=429 /DNA_ID=CAMNT_0023543945 /DNA_START=143 /DNA_END=1432 /DNA_ORIENTATION=+
MAAPALCRDALTYVAFLLVGTSCGWFVVNGLYNLIANEPEVAKGGQMMGEVNLVGSYVSLALCGGFALYTLCKSLSQRTEVWASSLLILISLLSLVLLACAWNVSPPGYPVVLICAATGSIVGNGSILLLFPLISTFYGGWLVAPVRAGTDLSSMISALLAETQSSDGTTQRYPSWLLFVFYSLISCMGLVAWAMILKHGIGLRDLPGKGDKSCAEDIADEAGSDSSATNTTSKETDWPREQPLMASLACPWELRLVISAAVVTQITQWAISPNLGEIGAEMCDPESCDGHTGRFIWRTSLTLSQILVPFGSLLSSISACPRWIFYILCLLQYVSCLLVTLASLGVWRNMWMSQVGQALFIASFAFCGASEGYLITMAYRYIGDASNVPLDKRHSAGALLGVGTVATVGVCGLILSSAVAGKHITCVAP